MVFVENSPRLPESFSLNIKSSSITDNLDKFSDRSSEESVTASDEKLLEGDNGFYVRLSGQLKKGKIRFQQFEIINSFLGSGCRGLSG